MLGHDAERLVPEKNEIIVRPTDLATGSFLRRLGFPVLKLANHFFSCRVPARLGNRDVFVAGGAKLICAMTSEVGCFSSPRNTLYSRITSYGRD